MPRKRQSQDLYVAMNGRAVAQLRRTAQGALRLTYEPTWLEAEDATPLSLSLPLSPRPHTGEVVANYFDNLLPDNESIRRRMQTTLHAASTGPFDLLAAAGADCVGALQLFPSPEMPDIRCIDAIRVTDREVAQFLRDYRANPLGMVPSRDDFRISLAGAQEKTGFLWHEGAWHRPVGATPTTHIFKLPIGSVQGMDLGDSVENEWLCLRIAKELGFRVPEAEIATFEDTKALVVERFDRRFSDDGRYVRRLPQEDFCQALGVAPARKYEVDGGPGIADCMELLQQSLDPLADRSTFLRAALFYWLLGAIDGHAKNFSFFLYPGGRCKLTPLYDVLSAYPLVGSGELALQRLKMAMAVKGTSRHYRWDGIRARHWISTAKHCRYPEARVQAILDELRSAIPSAIDRVGASLPAGFPGDVAGPVLEKLATASGKLASP